MNIIQKKVEVEAGALPLRSCAGIMLLNRDGLVWVGRRKPKWASDHAAHIWQMPQGGIEPFEPPCIAALRELREETGYDADKFHYVGKLRILLYVRLALSIVNDPDTRQLILRVSLNRKISAVIVPTCAVLSDC